MTEDLKEIGLGVGHSYVGRLMRQNGISVVRTRKYKVTTDSNHKVNIAPNLLDRTFLIERPNQTSADHISHVWTRESWLYLAVIPDLLRLARPMLINIDKSWIGQSKTAAGSGDMAVFFSMPNFPQLALNLALVLIIAPPSSQIWEFEENVPRVSAYPHHRHHQNGCPLGKTVRRSDGG